MSSNGPTSPSSGSAALEVVSSTVLLPLIGSFLRGVPVWTVEYEHKYGPNASSSSRNDCAKQSMGTPGLLPRIAIERGDLRTLERLYALHSQPQFLRKGKFWFTNAMSDAAACGALDALQWLHKNTSAKCPQSALALAAKNGHLAVIKWLLTRNGDLDWAKLLHAKVSGVWTPGAIDQVVANGHLDVLKFLYENGFGGWSKTAVDVATMNGHSDVVRWLVEARVVGISSSTTYFAVVHDRLDILRYLCETDLSSRIKKRHELIDQGMRQAAPYALAHARAEMLAFLRMRLPDTFPLQETTKKDDKKKQPDAVSGSECDASTNRFAPSTSTATRQRAKSKSRRPPVRTATRQSRTQGFLSLTSAPNAEWIREENRAT